MLLAYSILLVLYIGLTLLYAYSRKDPVSIPSWPLLSADLAENVVKRVCQQHSDCPSNQVCLNGECVQKFLKDGTCQPETGEWVMLDVKGQFFALCQCIDDTLFTQPVFGADCTLSVACGVHGTYDLTTQTCRCDPGYIEKDLRCRKMRSMEYQQTQPCASNETRVSDLPQDHPFHADYLQNLNPQDCVTHPCTFDAFTGRPLSHTFHENNWGCVCDPSYGLFGVQLETPHKKYLKAPGFDACASIFREDPEKPIPVKLLTYFFIKDPISIVLFENLPLEKLNPLFKSSSFMLGHLHWRYDFAQHFFAHRSIQARIPINRYRVQYERFHPARCEDLGSHNMDLKTTYFVLYGNPICLAPAHDPQYGDRYIVRPEHILFQKHLDDTPRHNAFILEYEVDMKRWSLDTDYPYKVDYYREQAGQGLLQNIRWYY